jgi:RND family efflux transporter MFP subunit
MKNIILPFAASLFLLACAAPETNESLTQLKERRDSLKNVVATASSELLSVEEEIARLDDDFSLLQVTSFIATSSNFEHYFTVQGNIETDRNAQVYPETQGIVLNILVVEGQAVQKGQTIMTLDTDIVQKNIAEVETQYTLAKDVFERQERLWKQNIGSEVQYLEAKTNKERLEKTLSTLRSQASLGVVKAPFAGIVDKITPKLGEIASPMMPVARIVSLDNMYVTANVSESYLPVVKENMRTEVVIPGIDTVDAVISRVGRFINPENRSFEIGVKLAETDKLRPNMYCALRIYDTVLDSVITIPNSLIQQDTKGSEFVFVLDKSGANYKVRKQIITTGASSGDNTLVTSGIAAGDQIIDKGARRVIDGQEVDVFSAQNQTAIN